jgi:hypothetical protein
MYMPTGAAVTEAGQDKIMENKEVALRSNSDSRHD